MIRVAIDPDDREAHQDVTEMTPDHEASEDEAEMTRGNPNLSPARCCALCTTRLEILTAWLKRKTAIGYALAMTHAYKGRMKKGISDLANLAVDPLVEVPWLKLYSKEPHPGAVWVEAQGHLKVEENLCSL